MDTKSILSEAVARLTETIIILRQAIEVIDEGKYAQGGALLGSQATILTQFLQQNKDNATVLNAIKKIEKMLKTERDRAAREFMDAFLKAKKKKQRREDLKYVG